MEILLILGLLILSLVAMTKAGAAERLARTLDADVKRLRTILIELRKELDGLKGGGKTTHEPEATVPKTDTVEQTSSRPVTPAPPQESVVPVVSSDQAAAKRAANVPPFVKPSAPTAADLLFGKIKSYFTGSRLFVSVGVILLTFGAGFLIKLGIDYGLFPIELRIAFVGLIGMALLVLGWRLREKKRDYALLLQGGGVGLMYMTTFAAAKLFDVIPLPAAFVVMIVLVIFSGILAVLQDAKLLAFFGAAGGFLAPILTSTGQGSHVMLFGYYALLNAGILGIAWFRAWRELNLLGYAFTFVIGSLWGFNSYRPEFFASTEPFLILFFLFFTAIAILFAIRQEPNLKGYVDGTLVFGVPIVAFSLQAGLMHDTEYGMAFSALAMSVFYIGIATVLWKLGRQTLRLLTEVFLSLGVVFGTLAIPLAFDGLWIAAAWALEGAALVWIGVRQHRLLARLFGMILQFGAGISLLSVSPHRPEEIPVFNGFFMSSVLLATAGLFTQYYISRNSESVRSEERFASVVLFVWGLLWWYVPGIMEISYHLSHGLPGHVLFLSASAVLTMLLDSRLDWPLIRIPLFLILPVQGLFLLAFGIDRPNAHPFAYLGFLAWFVAFTVTLRQLFVYRNLLDGRYLKWHHAMLFWILAGLLSWEASWAIRNWMAGLGSSWFAVMWGLVPSGLVALLITQGRRIRWPVEENLRWYFWHGCIPVIAWIGVWAVVQSIGNSGHNAPLPYIPFFSPLDLTIAFVVLTVILWRRQTTLLTELKPSESFRQTMVLVLSGGCFLWLNGMIARTVHHYLDYFYTLNSIWGSVEFQSAISIAWTVLALVLMIIAHRNVNRLLWLGGAGLLVAVVIKLFLVELDKSGAVARVVSFMVVGVLMLVIGYFVPLPPKHTEKSS